MPANPNSPFGFRFVKMIDGTAPTYGTRKGFLKGGSGGNSNSIFSGDVLKPSAAGYFDVATVTGGGAAIGGIAESFEWVSISQQKTVRQLYWPGTPTDANGDVTVNFYSNPGAVFLVQCLLGPIPQAKVGMFANFAVGGGGRTVGLGNFSSFTLDDGTLTDTQGSLVFRVYGLPVSGPLTAEYAMPGFDPTQAYNQVWATMVNLSPE